MANAIWRPTQQQAAPMNTQQQQQPAAPAAMLPMFVPSPMPAACGGCARRGLGCMPETPMMPAPGGGCGCGGGNMEHHGAMMPLLLLTVALLTGVAVYWSCQQRQQFDWE